MKITPIFLFGIIALLLYSSCKKNNGEDSHNKNLLNKTLPEIQATIAGKWQLKRSHFYVCGIAGCNTWDTTYTGSNGDFVYFLANDTVKQTAYSGVPIKIYEKAVVYKIPTYGDLAVDSAYVYDLANGYYFFIMKEIKNDSLVIYDAPYTHYLIR